MARIPRIGRSHAASLRESGHAPLTRWTATFRTESEGAQTLASAPLASSVLIPRFIKSRYVDLVDLLCVYTPHEDKILTFLASCHPIKQHGTRVSRRERLPSYGCPSRGGSPPETREACSRHLIRVRSKRDIGNTAPRPLS